MRVVIKRPNQDPEIVKIKNSLGEFQKIVGGIIQIVRFCDLCNGESIHIICDDEGKIKGSAPNILWEEQGDILCGNLIFVGQKKDKFGSLTERQINYIFGYSKFNEIKEDEKCLVKN